MTNPKSLADLIREADKRVRAFRNGMVRCGEREDFADEYEQDTKAAIRAVVRKCADDMHELGCVCCSGVFLHKNLRNRCTQPHDDHPMHDLRCIGARDAILSALREVDNGE